MGRGHGAGRGGRGSPRLSRPGAPGGSLVWVTAEPRLDDNAALRAAAQAAGPLSLLFVEAPLPGGGVGGFHAASSGAYDPEESRRWPLGRAARAFLARSLASLDSDLVTLRGSAPGGGLLCRRGDPAVTVPEVARALGVARVLGSRRYEPGQWEEDERVAHALAKEGIPLTLLPGFLLHEPQYVRLAFPGKWTGHFGTLTPFVAACRELEEDLRPLPPPEALPPPHAPELVAAARSMPVAQLSLDGGGEGGDVGRGTATGMRVRRTPGYREAPVVVGARHLGGARPSMRPGRDSVRRLRRASCGASRAAVTSSDTRVGTVAAPMHGPASRDSAPTYAWASFRRGESCTPSNALVDSQCRRLPTAGSSGAT